MLEGRIETTDVFPERSEGRTRRHLDGPGDTPTVGVTPTPGPNPDTQVETPPRVSSLPEGPFVERDRLTCHLHWPMTHR